MSEKQASYGTKVHAAAPIVAEHTLRVVKIPVHVPGFVRFIARQPTGEWWGFQNEPKVGTVEGDTYEFWLTEEGGETYLGTSYIYRLFPSVNDWRESLIRIRGSK